MAQPTTAARLINRSIVSPIAACTAAFIVGRSQMAGLTLKFKQLRVALRREDWAARVRPLILRGLIFWRGLLRRQRRQRAQAAECRPKHRILLDDALEPTPRARECCHR